MPYGTGFSGKRNIARAEYEWKHEDAARLHRPLTDGDVSDIKPHRVLRVIRKLLGRRT